MDVARSFSYMLKQPGGVSKLIIAGLLLFIPILGWAVVAGYMLRVLRGVAQGDEQLPEWNDFGDFFVKGLLLWVGGLIYQVPGFVLQALGSAGDTLSFLWGLVVFIALPAAATRYALTDDFGSFFQFENIWNYIRDNLNNYIMAVVLAFVAGILASFGIILLVLGVVFTIAWAGMAGAHLYGSVWASRAQDNPAA